jgi:hypothetical protein
MDALPLRTQLARTAPVQRSSRAALVWLMAGAMCCLLLACAGKPPSPAVVNKCPPNRPGCQIEIVFTDVGLGERVARLEGRLSADQPNVTYVFTVDAGTRMRLKFSGPAIRLLLTRPNGQVDGPGLPVETVLNPKGKYTLRVAVNTMADDSYGNFVLEMRLIQAP